jgi:RimJ/RimL family protein N-acetyltransferase
LRRHTGCGDHHLDSERRGDREADLESTARHRRRTLDPRHDRNRQSLFLLGLDRLDPSRHRCHSRGRARTCRGLHRLELLTHADNPVSQRVALAAGYRREGVRRGALPDRHGGRDDMVAFVRLRTDSGEPVPRLLPDLPGGELTDGVVRLRPLGPGDTDFLARLRGLPEIIETSVPPTRPDPAEIAGRCGHAESLWLAGQRADLVISDAVDGAPAGEIGLFYQEPVTGQAMIGYSMLPAFRGRGFATRAAQLLTLWAFAETDIARIIAGAMPSNVASQRVLEKAGFHREAYLKSRLPGVSGRIDDVQFVLLAEDLLREGPRLDG